MASTGESTSLHYHIKKIIRLYMFLLLICVAPLLLIPRFCDLQEGITCHQ